MTDRGQEVELVKMKRRNSYSGPSTTELTKTSVFCTESSRYAGTSTPPSVFSRKENKSLPMSFVSFRHMANYLAEGNLQAFRCYIENPHIQVDDKDENGQTLLMLAAQKGNKEFIVELINHGADVNAVDFDNWSALLNAAKEGHYEVVKELLNQNAEIEHRDMGGWTALMWACYKGRVRVVKLLLERKAEPNVVGQYHISSLMWAAGRGFTEIVIELLAAGAKVNTGDKYGTTALIWACRKGHFEIVEELLRAGANVDAVGMYLWTPLLVATMGNFSDIVNLLLEYRPNVNAQDKDNLAALTIACKEGYVDIAVALLNVGAYVNVQDRIGDTNLILAVKAGHLEVAEALIKKYADVDVQGHDKKTALYWAVEKNHVDIVRAILKANPEMELATKDGDTPLMKATRNRNKDITQLLLDKKCKVSAVDKKGDTALHIAMKARCKVIVEQLLSNPQNSQLLYRPNRAGETPYNIDMACQKSILSQAFGARRLNVNEDNENMLGYDLYSSALADFLSEPTLSMPICVGLYAKWGSGKSFLLNKLQGEMTNFTREWFKPELAFSGLLFLLVTHISASLGLILGIVLLNWIVAVSVAVGTFIFIYICLAAVWVGIHKYELEHTRIISTYLARKITSIKLFLQVLFCNPSRIRNENESRVNPIRFLFTGQAKVSSTGNENSVAYMLASLFDAVEEEYGMLTTRFYTVFKPKLESNSMWKWRRICCIPNFLIFYATVVCIVVCIVLIFTDDSALFRGEDQIFSHGRAPVDGAIIALLTIICVIIVANMYTWFRMLSSLVYPTKKRLFRSLAKAQTYKMDELQAQKAYSQMLTNMVQCLDSFTGNQTRLVIIVDGLDSCEQEKVLRNLDAVHVLFSDPSTPFITLLAIDPHIIIKAIETNINRVFNDLNVNGYDYLRNIVHLPFYLQNSGMRKVRVAQHVAAKKMSHWPNDDRDSFSFGSGLGMSSRRFSSESSMSIPDRFKQSRKNSKKLKMSDSVASSMGNINSRITGAQDLTKVLLHDDYFSDVNPRSMRRLLNVVYITGRLLKAFNIDFNWYHLATWVNITEQWPYRTSWITLHFEKNENESEDNTSLKSIYDKLCGQIPTSKEVEPMLEIDRDENKFEIFLSYHKANLQIADLKMFLPFTINLDPYIRKVIKENLEDLNGTSVISVVPQPNVSNLSAWSNAENNKTLQRKLSRSTSGQRIQQNFPPGQVMYQIPSQISAGIGPVMWSPYPQSSHSLVNSSVSTPNVFRSSLPAILRDVVLSQLSVEDVVNMMSKLDGLNKNTMPTYCTTLIENNINGRVLLHCDMDDLKKVMKMSFGDWELFRMAIISLREQEFNLLDAGEGDAHNKNVHFSVQVEPSKDEPPKTSSTQTTSNTTKQTREATGGKVVTTSTKQQTEHATDKTSRNQLKRTGQQNTLEKQVSLEEQLIMGALQTLNEDAQEDARESMNLQENTAPASVSTLSPILSDPDEPVDALSENGSLLSSACIETDVLFLHTPPMSPPNQLFDDHRVMSPRRVQVVAAETDLWPRTPSPTPRARFSLTSVSSSQASGIDTLDFDESELNFGSNYPTMKPIRPSNLVVTPTPSYERINKMKSKRSNTGTITSPPRSTTVSPLPSQKKMSPSPGEEAKSTPSSSENDITENTPLVSPMRPPKPEQKAVLRSGTLTLTTPMSSSNPKEISQPSIEQVKKLNTVGASAFVPVPSSLKRSKISRGAVSFDKGNSNDDNRKITASQGELKRTQTAPNDLQSSSVTSANESQLVEVITSTETVL